MSEAFQESFPSPLTTKGDIFVYSTVNDRFAVGTNGQKIAADSTQSTGLKWIDDTQFVVKAADETVNNSVVLQNDDHLVFALAASTIYFFEMYLLLIAANTTADWKFGWTVPASCTMFWGPDAITTNTGFVDNYWAGNYITSSATAALLTEASTVSIASLASTHGVRLTGFVRNSTNAGNLQFQWSQDTASATDSKVLKDSFLRIRKLQ